MPVEDNKLEPGDSAYSRALTDVVMVRRQVRADYKKSYGGMSPYIEGLMGRENAELRYTVCGNRDGHDEPRVIRYLVPRSDCPECYEKTRWEKLPGDARFFVDTFSTAVELAGISFMDRLPVTVAWIKAVLADAPRTELDTLVAGMVSVEDYTRVKKGDELRPVFRREPRASASDVMWVPRGTPPDGFPAGYLASDNYRIGEEPPERRRK